VIGPLIDRSFTLPPGSPEYATLGLAPGPCEPSFSERESAALRFTILPLGPCASPVSRQHEATREMRRFVGPAFGSDALRWFDGRSEEWRGATAHSRAQYGAWFGPIFDEHGQRAARVYYELQPDQLHAVGGTLGVLARMAIEAMPSLVPVSTSLRCGPEGASQRITLLHRGPLQLAGLSALLGRLGLAHQLPGMMQIIAVALGGRFELPDRSVFLGLRETPEGPEVTLEILLDRVPDVPTRFLDLLGLALAERPRQLQAFGRWLDAFTPASADGPGDFTVLSVRATPRMAARVNLHLRPVGFEAPPARGANHALSAAAGAYA
jgi:hypothetical protein